MNGSNERYVNVNSEIHHVRRVAGVIEEKWGSSLEKGEAFSYVTYKLLCNVVRKINFLCTLLVALKLYINYKYIQYYF